MAKKEWVMGYHDDLVDDAPLSKEQQDALRKWYEAMGVPPEVYQGPWHAEDLLAIITKPDD